MGMYSFFRWEDITIKDYDGLVAFLELWKKTFTDSWIDMKDYEMLDTKNKTFSFEKWDNIKLVSYWYSETCLFLKLVGKYIEGEVSWLFENDEEIGKVYFKDGETKIEIGVMHFTENTAENFIDTEQLLNENKENADKIKSLLVLEGL